MTSPIPKLDAAGANMAVREVRLWTEGPEPLAAQANVTYVLPQP